jgi:hypothetical protein
MSNNVEVLNDELGTSDVGCNGTLGSPVQNSNSDLTVRVLGINQQSKISFLILVCFRHPCVSSSFCSFLKPKIIFCSFYLSNWDWKKEVLISIAGSGVSLLSADNSTQIVVSVFVEPVWPCG